MTGGCQCCGTEFGYKETDSRSKNIKRCKKKGKLKARRDAGHNSEQGWSTRVLMQPQMNKCGKQASSTVGFRPSKRNGAYTNTYTHTAIHMKDDPNTNVIESGQSTVCKVARSSNNRRQQKIS